MNSVLVYVVRKGRWLRVCTYRVLSSTYTNLPTVLFRDTDTLTKEKEAHWRNDPGRILPTLCKRQVEVDLVIYRTGIHGVKLIWELLKICYSTERERGGGDSLCTIKTNYVALMKQK